MISHKIILTTIRTQILTTIRTYVKIFSSINSLYKKENYIL